MKKYFAISLLLSVGYLGAMDPEKPTRKKHLPTKSGAKNIVEGAIAIVGLKSAAPADREKKVRSGETVVVTSGGGIATIAVVPRAATPFHSARRLRRFRGQRDLLSVPTTVEEDEGGAAE